MSSLCASLILSYLTTEPYTFLRTTIDPQYPCCLTGSNVFVKVLDDYVCQSYNQEIGEREGGRDGRERGGRKK